MPVTSNTKLNTKSDPKPAARNDSVSSVKSSYNSKDNSVKVSAGQGIKRPK